VSSAAEGEVGEVFPLGRDELRALRDDRALGSWPAGEADADRGEGDREVQQVVAGGVGGGCAAAR
jgi:hypothetical protein